MSNNVRMSNLSDCRAVAKEAKKGLIIESTAFGRVFPSAYWAWIRLSFPFYLLSQKVLLLMGLVYWYRFLLHWTKLINNQTDMYFTSGLPANTLLDV